MNLKLKATLLALTAALGFAGNASAALSDATSGNSALIFSAWDPTTGNSYSRALGFNLNSFLPNGPAGQTFAADSAFTTLFGSIASNANLLWNVAAADGNPNPGIGDAGTQFRLAATNSNPGTPSITAQNVSQATAKFNGYVSQLNSSPCSFGANTGSCASNSAADTWNINNGAAGWNGAAGLSGSIFTTAASVGQSLFFLLTANSGTSGLTQTGKTFYVDSLSARETWTLQNDGTLVWSGAQVAAVPVPAAVWLLGSGLMGLIGVGRRRESKKDRDNKLHLAAA